MLRPETHGFFDAKSLLFLLESLDYLFVLVAFDGEIGKGSGRSISRFDLHEALDECADLLERYGGHRMAAGLTIRRERLDEFLSVAPRTMRCSMSYAARRRSRNSGPCLPQ